MPLLHSLMYFFLHWVLVQLACLGTIIHSSFHCQVVLHVFHLDHISSAYDVYKLVTVLHLSCALDYGKSHLCDENSYATYYHCVTFIHRQDASNCYIFTLCQARWAQGLPQCLSASDPLCTAFLAGRMRTFSKYQPSETH